jgi:hypothetical protein
MGLDILLAIAGALVATYGIAKDLGPKIKRILIGVVALIAVATTLKAYFDSRDKDLMKAALVGTLVPTPASVATMYKLLREQAAQGGYTSVDYMRVDDGIVIYLVKPDRPDEAVVLDRLDIASLYAQILMEEGSSGPERVLWDYVPVLGYRRAEKRIIANFLNQNISKKDFDEAGFSENLYGRLCILAQASVRQVLHRHMNDCHYDDQRGLIITFDIGGQIKTWNVSAKAVTERFLAEKANTRILFAEVGRDIETEVYKLDSEPQSSGQTGGPPPTPPPPAPALHSPR